MKNQPISYDILGIIRRRKLGFIFISVPIFVAFLVTALFLPPIYRSTTTILIEGQQIPLEYVRTAVTSFIEERLEIIKQQVLSRTKLMEIINEHNLYPDMRKQRTWGEIVAKMRKDIGVRTISAEMAKGVRGGSGAATIAFTLSYEGKNPSVVQKVANVLASLYLEENVRTRERRAATTTQYLEGELKNVKAELNNIEQKITKLKIEHLGELPEYNTVNLQAVQRLNRDRDQINMQIRSLQDRELYLQGQFTLLKTQLESRSYITAQTANPANDPLEYLENLQLKLLARKAELSEKHPEIKRLKKQIFEFEAQLEKEDSSANEIKKIDELKSQLVKLKASYGSKHPDVIKKSKEIEALSRKIDTVGELASSSDPPALINLKYQIASTRGEIKHLLKERDSIKRNIEIYQKRIERAPFVEREYNNLLRDHEHSNRRYSEIMQELAEAKASQSLEETQKSERFTIIEPALLPEKPYKPDRTAIILVGFILAIGAGAGFAGIRESLDNTIKTADEVAYLTNLPLLSVLPLVKTDEQRRVRRIKYVAIVVGLILLIVLVLLAVHVFITPLDILMIKIQRRLSLLF
ncbi:MAG: hypothetical protein JRG97_10945 [Deltaproteobacteria bacterium]|nr:hypothetical protein [Deltaproteobacteria bacterium]MBW2323169.1 hypothetical protein [Deltaproteobacteria bacterium]